MTSPPGADARSSSSPSASERGGIHRGLDPLIDAGELARAEVVVLPVPMHRPTLPRAMRPVERSVEVLSYLAAHFRMVVQLWLRRDADLLLVREFLTLFLVLCWPLIWPLRQRVVVLVTFNLQEAHRRRVARLALRLLHRGGCRFACLECSEGFAELALATPERPPLVLPHPIDPSIVAERVQRVGRVPVVGVVGRARGEKGFEELLTRLHRLRAEGRLAADVLLGCPERDVRERWRVRGVEVVDTTARQAYLRALDRCDVVVFSFARDRYLHRASGVVVDALARGAAIACPDYPLLRRQLTWPEPVGALYADVDGLAAAIDQALALGASLPAARAAHVRERGAAAIAAILDGYAGLAEEAEGTG